ncbi:DUF3347 domain-containing protein [Arenibacter echinorum]|uniref:Copper chaperone CopZ n=1 Tax=Arenibacter echinorum TaxID=440515 RepID=A0A327RG38_9FLAO|nr:DUF3347 domain-containing protein [Arenibacter echinorum]RAJ15980.1 copper chaperone CopZ [Arenibacter echinorum]
MKNSINILITISVLLSFAAANAQAKNLKSESVKIFGNCAMCEKTIEKAGNLNNAAKVDWDKDTKMAIISFDTLATSKEEILKRIALAGYDSELFFAPDDTYANLPECCQYERAKKEAHNMESQKQNMTTDHSQHGSMAQENQNKNPLAGVFEHYFSVKDALVSTDGSLASDKAEILLKSVTEVEMDKLSMEVHMAWMKVLKDLKTDIGNIAATKDVDKQRVYFKSLSKDMFEVLKVSKSEKPVYYQFCPMADSGKGANWLSLEEDIKNPYYGSQMLSCGKTVETIK